jgi:hypothetical protein
MSHLTHAAHTAHALKEATKTDGLEGAVSGAIGIAGTAALGAAALGLVLTPLGWGVMLGLGATAGGTGAPKKLRSKFE